MTWRNVARLAIHRRADEMRFLQHRLRTLRTQLVEDSSLDQALETTPDQRAVRQDSRHDVSLAERDLLIKVLERERDLADELLHTRQVEPLGETLQRRLVMAEHICRDLARSGADGQAHLPDAYRVAEIERRALAEMLQQWWAWLHGP